MELSMTACHVEAFSVCGWVKPPRIQGRRSARHLQLNIKTKRYNAYNFFLKAKKTVGGQRIPPRSGLLRDARKANTSPQDSI